MALATLSSNKTNSLLYKLRMKMSKPKARGRGQNLSHVDRRAAAQRRSLKEKSIWEDLRDFWACEEEKIKELAVKHGKTERWMRQHIVRGTKYGQRRQVSKYHAWLHVRSLTINEGK